MKTFLLALIVLFGLVASAPLMSFNEKLEDEYIVVFHNNVTLEQQNLHTKKLFSTRDNSTMLIATYQIVLKGYHAKMNKQALQKVLADPLVDYVEENGVVRAIACDTQNNAVWGLKRISLVSPNPQVTNYKFPREAGTGVTAYIIDTGIRITHQDFEGRARFGFKATNTWSDTDMNGHGTHVASTVGGKTYGVAKKVTLVAVKVLGDNGSGSNAGVIAGVEHVTSNGKGKLSTANMSLGGGYSAALNTAVDNCVAAGIVVVVAAGNDNKDAKNYSPASSAKAVTVGSTAEGATVDSRSSFSNYGTGVDVFAPGSSITAAWITNDASTNTISGTSMASPHVCGVASLLLSTGTPVAQVKQTIINTANTGKINLNCNGNADCNNSPNRMLYSDC